MTSRRSEPRGARPLRLAAFVLLVAVALTACGSARHTEPTSGVPSTLLAQARPIGRGARFQPSATGPVIGPCRDRLGPRDGVHVEVFAADRVVLLAAGIGTRPPRTVLEGRITRARCYGDLVTVDPTGLVLVRPGLRLTLAELFDTWGQPLSRTRLASFPATAGSRTAVFVDGRPWHGSPRDVPLRRHEEIVLEVGPHVPPHAAYRFPPGS